MSNKLISISSILSIFIIWFLVFEIIDNDILIPSIIDTFKKLFTLLSSIQSLNVILMTFIRLSLSVLAASIFGIATGLLSARIEQFHHWMTPYVTIFKTTPIISFIIIVYVIFGYSIAPYVITFMILFPLFYEASKAGYESIDPLVIDSFKLERHPFKEVLFDFYIPLLKPSILTVYLQSFGLGLKVLVMAEYITQTPNSIGRAIYISRVGIDYASVFAWTILLIAITYSIDTVIKKYKSNLD
jgi:NitT/TauT family transport system permease protein